MEDSIRAFYRLVFAATASLTTLFATFAAADANSAAADVNATAGQAAAVRAALQARLQLDPQSNAVGERLRARLSLADRSALLRELGTARYPVAKSFLDAMVSALFHPNDAPPGVNVACKRSALHPRPLILVHGTFEDMEDNWGAIGPLLANNGYCVYALNYGGAPGALFQGLDSLPSSAMTVASFVEKVLAATGASQVDLVGHSQGGTLLEGVAKFFGLAPRIGKLVALVPSTHGTTVEGLATLIASIPGANADIAKICQACVDQEAGSPVLHALDAPPIAQRGPAYTVIETKVDHVITPPSSAFIDEPGVKNEYVQTACPADAVDHGDVTYDLVSIQLMLDALDPATAAAPDCALAYPMPA
jgi:pimeloyl-ACP methyl ester carboxylesterase